MIVYLNIHILYYFHTILVSIRTRTESFSGRKSWAPGEEIKQSASIQLDLFGSTEEHCFTKRPRSGLHES